jgi:DNA polymerase-3 subunit epsilon
MKWLLDGPLGCFDVESTGISVETDRIVTATVGLLQPGTPWSVDTKSWLIDPGVEIPEDASAIHGVTTEQVREHGEKPEVALDVIAADLARAFLARIPVIVMNGVFDFTMIERELRRHGLPTVEERIGGPVRPVVDVLVIDKWLDPYRKGGRRLTDLCGQYGVRIDGAHDSAFDALAAARVAYRIALMSQYPPEQLAQIYADRRRPMEVVERFAQLAEMSAADLHDAQIGWRRVQCDGLRTYFDSKGIAHDGVRGDWPLIPAIATDEAVLA